MQQTFIIIGLITTAIILGALLWAVFLKSGDEHHGEMTQKTQAAASPAPSVTSTTPEAPAPKEDILPPLTDADKQGLIDLRAALTLPASGLHIIDTQPGGPLASRIGGAVALPPHLTWPKDAKGNAMAFFAQINFEGMPPVEGFPDRGILYFFHGTDDLYGADFDAPRGGDYAVLWWDDPIIDGLPMPVLQDLGPQPYTPLTTAVLKEGRAMEWADSPAQMPPTFSDARIEAHTNGWWKREGGEDYIESLHDADWDIVPNTYVGGHPRFTQWDLRGNGQNQELTRVLFQAGSNTHFMWGDVGEAVFLISEEDLAARRFERAVFWWDCH